MKNRFSYVLFLLLTLSSYGARAASLVFDPAVLEETIAGWAASAAAFATTYGTQIQQYYNSLQQYETQLQQYETQVTNLALLPSQTWNGVVGPANQFLSATNSLMNMTAGSGGLQQFLGNFQTIGEYGNNGCIGLTGCTAAMQSALNASRQVASNAQINANTAVIQGTQFQQSTLSGLASTLETLQSSAANATGALQAATAGNQLQAFQAIQLLQLNGQIAAQSYAQAVRNNAQVDAENRVEAQNTAYQKTLSAPGGLDIP